MKKSMFLCLFALPLMSFAPASFDDEVLISDYATQEEIDFSCEIEAAEIVIALEDAGYEKVECELEEIESKCHRGHKPKLHRHHHHSSYMPSVSQSASDEEVGADSVPFSVSQPSTFVHIPLEAGNSSNWCGYASYLLRNGLPAANVVTSVSGNWVCPTLLSTPDNSYSAFWVGIDGYSSQTVEQIGTAHNWVTGGTGQQNYAWFEMYPGGAYQIVGFPCNPGDVMNGKVTYSGNNVFQLILTNQTRHVYVIIPSSYTKLVGAKRSSAEWIAEAPSLGNSVVPLSNFQTDTFSACSATINGKTGPIASPNWQNASITMVGPSYIKAFPSALNAGKNGFTVTWRHE